jgi:predicted MPP superfamily phosphohydrolase
VSFPEFLYQRKATEWRYLLKKIKNKKLVIMFIVIVFIIIFCIWENNDIVVSNYDYKTEKISDDLDGYKIAQISDLHNKEFGKNQKRLLQILKDEDPNLIVITGDVVDSRHTDIDVALEFVKGAVDIAPVYYVTGNHEYWLINDDWDKLMQGLEQYGDIILDNEVIEMGNVDRFYLIGLNDNNLSGDTLNKLCSDLDSDKLQIVLAHEPQYLNNYSEAEVDLVLSGHAHGGQFRLPFIGGLVAPDQGFFPKYTSGTFIENDTTMIVSRGLGNSIVPIRVFNRPEVVIVKLQRA